MRQDFQLLRSFFEEQIAFHRHLQLRVEDLQEGLSILSLPYRPELLGDPFRPALHGGVTATLVDAAGGLAALSTAPLGSKCSTVDMRVDYLRPARPEGLRAEARVVRAGSQVVVVNVVVMQSEQVAEGRAVYSLKRGHAPR